MPTDDHLDDLSEQILEGSTLDDYIVGLAEGVAQAQQTLNRMAVDAPPGMPRVQYQMPRVEFELKVTLDLKQDERTTTSPGSTSSRSRLPARRQIMKVNKVGTDTAEAHLASTIKGSFVAVPVGNGQPLPLLTLEVNRESATKLEVIASVTNTAGEPMVGETVQFNVDRDHSDSLNVPAKITKELRPETQFEQAELVTDEDGLATSTLIVSPQEKAGTHVVIVVDAAELNETLIYRVKKG